MLKEGLRKGEPLYVVGGHAVNAWAHHFLPHEPRLSVFAPFTSKDLDCLGALGDVLYFHNVLGWPYIRGKSDPFETVAGIISYQPDNGPKLVVEFLKYVQGAGRLELLDRRAEISFFVESEEFRVRLPDPVLLLKVKIENAMVIDQNNPGRERQDIKHVHMMSLCCHRFLLEILEHGDLKSRIRVVNNTLDDFIELNEKHRHTKEYTQKYTWDIKDCIPVQVVQLAHNSAPLYRKLQRNLVRLGFGPFPS